MSQRKKSWDTPVNVKLLRPPRQSRGISLIWFSPISLARRTGGGFLDRRTALSAAKCPLASALWHEPGRADRVDDQHRAAPRCGDAGLLPLGLGPGFLRDFAEGMDGRPDKTVPGLFRRADVRQSRAPPHGQIHAGRFQADRDPPAAAER